MSSASKPLIVVTGATGAQGGSVVRFLLADGGYSIRAITRNVESPKALALKEKGVDVVSATFDDTESLRKAFEGAYGVFAVTNYWDPSVMSEEKEVVQGKNLVDAAKSAGVKHFVFSALEYIEGCEHGISKDRINKHLIESGLPRTSVYTAFYWENLIIPSWFDIKKSDDGKLSANWPLLKTDGPLPGYSVGDTGAWVVAALKEPKTWIGKDIKIVSEIFTPRQFVAAVEEVGGVKVELTEVDDAAFDALKNVKEMKEMYSNFLAFYETNGTMGRTTEEIETAKKLHPKFLDLKAFVKANIDKLLPK